MGQREVFLYGYAGHCKVLALRPERTHLHALHRESAWNALWISQLTRQSPIRRYVCPLHRHLTLAVIMLTDLGRRARSPHA